MIRSLVFLVYKLPNASNRPLPAEASSPFHKAKTGRIHRGSAHSYKELLVAAGLCNRKDIGNRNFTAR